MKPSDAQPDSRIMRALQLQQAGQREAAAKLFLQELREDPKHFVALYSLAALENAKGANDKALGYIDRALRVMPKYALAHQARSTILAQLGRYEEALRSKELASRLQEPANAAPTPEALAADGSAQTKLTVTKPAQQLGISLQAQGDHAGARRIFEQLLAEDSRDAISLYSMAVITASDGQTVEALAYADRTIGAVPDYAPAHFARGTLLQRMGLYDDALSAFDRALEIQPDYLEAYNNRASLLQGLSREYEALESLLRALQFHPNDSKLLMNAGMILTTFKRDTDAIGYFDRLIAIDPDYDYAEGYRFFAKLHTCNWQRYEEHRSRIIEGVQAGKRLVNPLAFFAMTDDAAAQLRCAQMFTEHRYPASGHPLWKGETYRHHKIRVGYLSPDLREHPVGHLMSGVIEHHDKTRFELFGFSLGINDNSALRKRFKLAFDHFIDCKEKPSHEIAQLIRAAEIDVLVDLAGYTSGSRAEVLAMRPAPIQVNYLGYPGTMGAAYMDYIIADEIVIPKGDERFYQEKVLRLPHCYLPIDDSLQIAEQTPSRESCGLPASGLVFCSFNHDYKINPPMWKLWMDLLREHPQSVLWLMKLNDDAMKHLREQAQAHDIDPNRLVFATRVPRVEDHLARYRHADVFLDTAPYNAHSTATDVSRVGVPIVTLAQGSFASRVAASVLHSLGVEQGRVVKSYEAYWKAVHDALDRKAAHEPLSADRYPSTVEHALALEMLYADAVSKHH